MCCRGSRLSLKGLLPRLITLLCFWSLLSYEASQTQTKPSMEIGRKTRVLKENVVGRLNDERFEAKHLCGKYSGDAQIIKILLKIFDEHNLKQILIQVSLFWSP